MTKLSDLGPPIIGRLRGKQPDDERDHFHRCPVCGQAVDRPDLRWHEQPAHENLELDG
ncbi:hypothetical protein SAMN03159463_05022 [Mesorhizobium sp. NFR06]|uniref:hypothetical protein n=1 Tax=Mesorhizobium sp. NFR06 TaxID=1566290 RepID=UPI0008F3A226|nr:hypothetical protein [Mesorhizobium sp. NFR06]SFP86574.1 hypothetical protein SAMN03159463_05022 [Mesorhizobium sp. NFR06]